MSTVTEYVEQALQEEEARIRQIKHDIDNVKSEFTIQLIRNEKAENYYANEKKIEKAIDPLAEEIHNLEKLEMYIRERPNEVDQTQLKGVDEQIKALSKKKRQLHYQLKTFRENRPKYLAMIVRIKERKLYELESELKNRPEKYQIEDQARKEYQDRYVEEWREKHGQNKLKL